MSHGCLEKQMILADEQIAQLIAMAKAEEADSTPLEDGLNISREIKPLSTLGITARRPLRKLRAEKSSQPFMLRCRVMITAAALKS